MTDDPLSRRQFFGAMAVTAAVGALPASAAEARPSPFAPEPPPPDGVCQRLGSARFRELEGGYQFSPDSKWLAEFDGHRFVAYVVASGRRFVWQVPDLDPWDRPTAFRLTADARVAGVWADDDLRQVRWFSLEAGRELGRMKLPNGSHHAVTPDGRGLVSYDDKLGRLWRTDLRGRKREWSREWKADAGVPAVALDVTERWVVAVGVNRLHLFDPLTGKQGPKLEEAKPKDAPPDHHFTPIGFSADGKRVCGWFTCAADERVVVWELDTGKVVGRVTPPSKDWVCLSPDGEYLLATLGKEDNRLAVLDACTGKLVRRLAATHVGAPLLSPDGKVLVVRQTAKTNFALIGPIGPGPFNPFISQVPPAPGEDAIEQPLRLLDPATGLSLPQSPDPACNIGDVRFADPNTVVASSAAGPQPARAWLWDCRTGAKRAVPPPAVEHLHARLDVSPVLSPDGRRHLTTVGNRLWVTDAFTGRQLHAVKLPPTAQVDDAGWINRRTVGVRDGQTLYVCGADADTWRALPLRLGKKFWDFDLDTMTGDDRTLAFVYWVEVTDGYIEPHVAWVDLDRGRVSTTPLPASSSWSASIDANRVAVTNGPSPDESLGGKWSTRVTVLDRNGRRFEFAPPTESEGIGVRVELSACGRMVFLIHARPDPAHRFTSQPVLQFWEVLARELRTEFALEDRTHALGVDQCRRLAASPCGRRVATTHPEAPIYLWDVFGEKSDPQAKPDATIWDSLDGPTDKAFTAIRRLVQHPAATVELLAAKLTPAESPKAEWVKALIDELGSTDFRTRHAAELELSAVADRIAEPLRKAIAAGADSPEADERMNRLLEKAEGMPRSAVRVVRAVEVLEYCDVPAAAVLLKKLAGGVESAVLTREAKAAVRRRQCAFC